MSVTVPSTLIAITQSAGATSLRGDEIEKMPRGRDFMSLVTQVPGANGESKLNGLSLDGAGKSESRVLIDGAESTHLIFGGPGQRMVTDFVDEFQIKSSGYSAEYGGSTGSVLSVVTKSGTNAWHGTGVMYWSGAVLDAGPRQSLRLVPDDTTRAEYVRYPEDPYTRLEPGLTVGGPLLRG